METISFARGIPAPDCLPVGELADCAREAIAREGAGVLNYGPAGGFGPLREWIAARHGVDVERVLVTNGSLQGFSLIADLLLGSRGARVIVEAPTYDRPLCLLARLGVDVAAVPLSDDGLDLDALRKAVEGTSPAFLYTIPTFQNPSGRTQPLAARRRLVELAKEHGVLLFEDDPYSLVRFEGEPLPSLFELAGGEGVVYSSSFSKIVAPGLRVGYLVMPADLAPALLERATQAYLSPASIGQATVHEFIRRGRLEPNISRVCGLLRDRRDAMLDALEQELRGVARWNRPEGGYFLWVDFEESEGQTVLAAAEGVTFVPGTDFYPDGRGERSARLAYSFADVDEIRAGVARLAAAVEPAAVST